MSVNEILKNVNQLKASTGDLHLSYIRPIHPNSNSKIDLGNWAIGDKDYGKEIEATVIGYRLKLEETGQFGKADYKNTILLDPASIENTWTEDPAFVEYFTKYPDAVYSVEVLLYLTKEDIFATYSIKQTRIDNFATLVSASQPDSGEVATLVSELKRGRGNISWFELHADSADSIDLGKVDGIENALTAFSITD